MNRAEQYRKFRKMCQLLELYAEMVGLPIRDGEAHRPPEMCEIYARRGTGIVRSKHRYSLARDYWLYGNSGREILWATTPETKAKYLLLGQFWEFLGGKWGGRFKSRRVGRGKRRGGYDPYHYEYAERPA